MNHFQPIWQPFRETARFAEFQPHLRVLQHGKRFCLLCPDRGGRQADE